MLSLKITGRISKYCTEIPRSDPAAQLHSHVYLDRSVVRFSGFVRTPLGERSGESSLRQTTSVPTHSFVAAWRSASADGMATTANPSRVGVQGSET